MTPQAMGHPGDLLSAHLDGELSPAVEAEVEEHVASCPACRNELAELGGARDTLRSLPRLEAPPGFTRNLVRTRRRSSRRGVGMMLVAAGVAIVAGLVLAPSHPDTSDHPNLALQSAARFQADLSGGPTTTSDMAALRAQRPSTTDAPAGAATVAPSGAAAPTATAPTSTTSTTAATGSSPTDASPAPEGGRSRSLADRVGDAVGALLDAIGG